ncbi:MAG: polysaccharide deacetylase family protein, partial [Flavobacteriales bacterium]|nr:polysaccharide deacetylase family protein [Flavobacteriales bacterium]
MFFARTPRILHAIFPKWTWALRDRDKQVYLTFDDGPCLETTAPLLDLLKAHNVAATFFCLGSAVDQHPDLFRRIIVEGHAIGNHTWSHVNGFKTPVAAYIEEAERCATRVDSHLFRPPYGRITPSQARALRRKGYRIVMWTSLSGDYDPSLLPEACARNVLHGIKAGDIMVFHDSAKSRSNVLGALPEVIAD